jgi:hypothetical protein
MEIERPGTMKLTASLRQSSDRGHVLFQSIKITPREMQCKLHRRGIVGGKMAIDQ